MRPCYWAVRPADKRRWRGDDLKKATRVTQNKCCSPQEACDDTFGRGPSRGAFEAKNLGSTVAVFRSHKRLIEAIESPDGWEKIE